MRRFAASLSRALFRSLSVGLVGVLVAGGCGKKSAPPPPPGSRYPVLPPKEVPEYLKGSILQAVDVVAINPMPVSTYGLVADLNGTGDTRCSNIVREWMIKQMERRGFGSRMLGYGQVTPERVLSDPAFAIVRVDGYIPPGARRGQSIDVQVSCLDGNNTTSLAGGTLYRAEMRVNGANPQNPNMQLDTWSTAEGGIFVNPAYALEQHPTQAEARSSLRVGVVMDGGTVQIDRPIVLRLRQPSYRVAREIEYRLDDYFQNSAYASAVDDGVVKIMMPTSFNGDWEHFIGVVQHVFFNNAPQYQTLKAQQLAEEAVKPDAPLLDISYSWEALGVNALPFVTPLMTHERPEVAYAAARAAAFLGDTSSLSVLTNIAKSQDNPFRLNAVGTLAMLPQSPVISGMLRSLLSSDQMLVRLEAYRALVRNEDPSIATTIVKDRFALDVIDVSTAPVIYASRLGAPRIALFGRKLSLTMPLTFSTINGKLSISSTPDRSTVTIFYRGPDLPKPIVIESNPDIVEIAARLGGMGPMNEPALNFGYGEIVAILQGICDAEKVTSIASATGARTPATFVLQDIPLLENSVYGAPIIPDQTRPEGEAEPATVPQPAPPPEQPQQRPVSAGPGTVRPQVASN